MSYDLGSVFAPVPSQHNMWGAQPYSSASSGFSNGNMLVAGGYQGARGLSDLSSVPPPPKAESISGFGQLTWLSAKAGLITCKDRMVISFQIKDFCDMMLTDLTSVLRVGFTLAFQASLNETNEYTATLVQPLYGQEADAVFADAVEVDLEAAAPTAPNSKDAYDLASETRAIPALLAIFQRHANSSVQLSSLHSQMSNCGDDELFRYVGTSSLKRRQFVERRTHVFILRNDDSVQLQAPAVYLGILRLASHLLKRGGATAIQSLYEYYVGPEMAPEIRDWIGTGRQDFLALIVGHPWIFALFPNRTYVSVRRNLPHFDYPSFVKKMDPSRPPSSQLHFAPAAVGGNTGPRAIQRSMSSHQPLGAAYSVDRPLALYQNNQLDNLQHSNPAPPLASAPARDQWSPLSSNWNRTATDFAPPMASIGGGVIGSLAPGAKMTSTVAVQTEPMRNESGSCACGCTCGGRLGLSRASGGSASPPSLQSTSPSTGDRFSPGSSGPAPIGDRPDGPPPRQQQAASSMKYYDPFGTDQLLTGFGFSLN